MVPANMATGKTKKYIKPNVRTDDNMLDSSGAVRNIRDICVFCVNTHLGGEGWGSHFFEKNRAWRMGRSLKNKRREGTEGREKQGHNNENE